MFYNRQTNCVFIDFYQVLNHALQKTVDTLVDLNLLEITEDIIIDLKNRNVKNVIYHHILHTTCESVIHNQSEGFKVVYYQTPLKLDNCYFSTMGDFNVEHLTKIVQSVVKDIQKHIPILIYTSNLPIIDLKNVLNHQNGGETQHHTMCIIDTVNRFDPTYYRFDKIQKYAKKKQLNFLSEQYFSQLSTKKLLYTR